MVEFASEDAPTGVGVVRVPSTPVTGTTDEVVAAGRDVVLLLTEVVVVDNAVVVVAGRVVVVEVGGFVVVVRATVVEVVVRIVGVTVVDVLPGAAGGGSAAKAGGMASAAKDRTKQSRVPGVLRRGNLGVVPAEVELAGQAIRILAPASDWMWATAAERRERPPPSLPCGPRSSIGLKKR